MQTNNDPSTPEFGHTVDLATRLADPGDEVREHLTEAGFGDCWDMPLWQRQHLAAVIESFIADRVDALRCECCQGVCSCGGRRIVTTPE